MSWAKNWTRCSEKVARIYVFEGGKEICHEKWKFPNSWNLGKDCIWNGHSRVDRVTVINAQRGLLAPSVTLMSLPWGERQYWKGTGKATVVYLWKTSLRKDGDLLQPLLWLDIIFAWEISWILSAIFAELALLGFPLCHAAGITRCLIRSGRPGAVPGGNMCFVPGQRTVPSFINKFPPGKK